MDFIRKIRRNRFVCAIENRINKIIAIQLAKQRMDNLAYNSIARGVNVVKPYGEEIIVTLTTHEKRILSVHRAIESIFQQSMKVNKIVLYVSNEEFQKTEQLPIVLQRQMDRGLEVRFVRDIGPYTKLLYALTEYSKSLIITIDDDIIYPINMVERLVMAHQGNKNAICGLAVRQLEWKKICESKPNKETRLRKFKKFSKMEFAVVQKDCVSNMFCAEGFGGVLYPPHCFSEEIFNEKVFMKLAPKADDLWFWINAVLNKTPILCVHSYEPIVRELLIDEDIQDIGLINDNFYGNGNDKQMKLLCEHYNIYSLLE